MTRNESSEILKLSTTTIADLLKWLEDNLGATEKLDIHQWCNEWFYIVVVDTREGWSHPEETRAGFTVDIKADKIMWSNEPYPTNTHGGNCFVRTSKWKGLLRQKFGPDISTKFRWYKNFYLKKGGQ